MRPELLAPVLQIDIFLHEHLLEHDLVFARMPGTRRIPIGARCDLGYDAADVAWFDPASGRRRVNGSMPVSSS